RIEVTIDKDELYQEYLGMRKESVYIKEYTRRINEENFDKEEFEKALKWTKENARVGFDKNEGDLKFTDEQHEEKWETVVKMALIGRDLMVGNEKLAEMGYAEEAMGHNALVSGFQG